MKIGNNKEVFVSYFIHTKDGMEHDLQFQFDGWDQELMVSKFEEFMKTIKMIKPEETISIVKKKKKSTTE